MANVKRSYFLAPNWTYEADGPIALGSIITDPRCPEDSLNAESEIPLPMINVDSTKADYRAVLGQSRDIGVGVSASILSFLGVGGDLTVHKTKNQVHAFDIKRLRTQQFAPALDYVEANMQLPNVQRYLQDTKFRRDLYMITGIQIAYGGSISSFSTTQHGYSTQIGVNGIPAGVPLEIGPHLSSSAEKTAGISFGPATEFVFAYRLKKIIYMKKTKSVKMRDHVKGTTLSHEDFYRRSETEADVRQNEGESHAELVGLDEEEIGGDEFELQDSMIVAGIDVEYAEYVVAQDMQ